MRRQMQIRILALGFLVLILAGLPSQVSADPVWIVFRDTIGGSLAGLLVGIAIDVAREGDDADATRVCFVAGTFAGLGLGIYQATRESKSEKHSLLNITPGDAASLHVTLPEVVFNRQMDAAGREYIETAYKLRLVGLTF